MSTCGGGGGQEVGVGGGEVGVQEELVSRALETCQTHHQFIASQAEHLERLRSQCATSAQLTQQEIRTLEAGPWGYWCPSGPSLLSLSFTVLLFSRGTGWHHVIDSRVDLVA